MTVTVTKIKLAMKKCDLTSVITSMMGHPKTLERATLAFAMSVGMASDAFAQATTFDVNPATLLTAITSQILGPMGTSLAVIGIIAIGLMWMFGRASLSLVAGVIGGIAIMFGASWIATQLTGAGAAA